MERVIAYVDGFNLFFGLRELRNKDYYWLNLCKLIEYFLSNNQNLVTVKYFTADMVSPVEKKDRQLLYLAALRHVCGSRLEIIKGRFIAKKVKCAAYWQQSVNKPGFTPTCVNAQCNVCNGTFTSYEEKRTDVNIATTMLADAFDDKFDTAFLVSADTDLIPPLEIITTRLPLKKLHVLFPPRRQSDDLKNIVGSQQYSLIGEKQLKNSLLPLTVNLPNGSSITKPTYWT